MWASRSKLPRFMVVPVLAVLATAGAGWSWAAEEVTAPLSRYREREMSTGFYEEYEVLPRRLLPFVSGGPQPRAGVVGVSPFASTLGQRGYQGDAHQGVKFYERRSCVECHPAQARGMHTVRERITCRQCHGGEPMASIDHYYSPLNPIRRHAYVCAKCHAGANASFATYVVHEPAPYSAAAYKSFPLLSYIFWVMAALAAGTFALFLPHAIVWGLRELLPRKDRAGEP